MKEKIANRDQDWPPETTGMCKLDLAGFYPHVNTWQLSKSWVTTRPMSHSSRWYWTNAKSMDSLHFMCDNRRLVTSTIGTVRSGHFLSRIISANNPSAKNMGCNQARNPARTLWGRMHASGSRCNFQGRLENAKGTVRDNGRCWSGCRTWYRESLRLHTKRGPNWAARLSPEDDPGGKLRREERPWILWL